MATLEELLSEDAPAEKASLEDLLSDAPSSSTSAHERAPASGSDGDARTRASKWHERAATGFMDPVVGVGQLMQNIVPDGAMNVARKAAGSIAGAMGASPELVEDIAAPRSTGEFNALVRDREQQYQGERAAAGKEGLDWTRIGGNLANPMTWLSPAGKGGTLWEGIKAGVKAGAFQSLLQPVTQEGNYFWDKGTQTALGASVGGVLGGTLQLLSPAFKQGVEAARKTVGAGDDTAAQTAAQGITQQTLKAAGADPAKVDPNLYSSIQREVADALKAGVSPDPAIMARHADAAALPVPVTLTRGQAARDPMQFAWEHRVAGQQGVGEPLSALLSSQNRALVQNLNALGAATAPEPFAASQQVIQHINQVDDGLRARIGEAYSAVRDSAGRPARVSNDGFLEAAKSRLTGGKPELADMTGLADYLPDAVRKQYNDIAMGKLPLTVDTIQFLDRAWGGVQRGAADDTQRAAIGALRSALNEAPVDDALGQQSMQAYKAARAMAKQRFDLIDANPAYKAIVEGTKQAEPDKFFQTFIENGNVSQVKALKELVGPEITSMLQNTTVGQLKRAALNKGSDEASSFSQAGYNRVMQDPVRGPRIRELFADNPKTLDQLYRVGRVSENLIKIPAASKVNTSNTASATANIVRDVMRSETGQAVSSMLPNMISGLGKTLSDAGRKVQESRAVQEAIRPAVTSAPIPRPAQPQYGRLSDLITRGGAATVASEQRKDERE